MSRPPVQSKRKVGIKGIRHKDMIDKLSALKLGIAIQMINTMIRFQKSEQCTLQQRGERSQYAWV